MPKEGFTHLPPEAGAPLEVCWQPGCTHERTDDPGQRCFCFMICTTSQWRAKFLWPDSPHDEDDKVGFGFTLLLDADMAGRLIETLQQARRETYGARPAVLAGG